MKKKYLSIVLGILVGLNSIHAQNTYGIASGTKLVTSGNIQVVLTAGNIANNGSYTDTTGTLLLAGAVTNSGSGTTTLNNLIINHSAATSVFNASVSVSNILTLSAGTLNSNGNLTLRSTTAKTAMLAPVPASGAAITGNVILERYIPSDNRKKYSMVGSPVISPTLYNSWQEGGSLTSTGYGTQITGPTGTGPSEGFDGISNSGTASVFTYNDNNVPGTKWVSLLNTNVNTVGPDKGFLLFVRGDRSISPSTPGGNNTALRASGTLTTGDYSPALLTAASKYSLIVNPYPCTIDWNSANIVRTNVTGTFTAYDPVLNVFVTSDGLIVSPSGSTQQPGFIQSGQAFFVQNAASGTPSITFKETAKTTSASTAIGTTVFGTEKKQQLNINVFRAADNSFADGTVALFAENYKAGIAGEDAWKLENFNESFALRRSGQNLSIEGRPLVKNTDTLFLSLVNFAKKEYVLKIDGFNLNDAQATLIDKYATTSLPLDLTQKTNYRFTVNGDVASAANDRFMVVFGNSSQPVIADAVDNASIFVKVSPNPVVNQLLVSFKTAAVANTVIKIINSLGQQVRTVHAGKVNTGNITIPVNRLAAGTYTVQLLSGNKNITTQKVVKN